MCYEPHISVQTPNYADFWRAWLSDYCIAHTVHCKKIELCIKKTVHNRNALIWLGHLNEKRVLRTSSILRHNIRRKKVENAAFPFILAGFFSNIISHIFIYYISYIAYISYILYIIYYIVLEIFEKMNCWRVPEYEA